MITAQAPPTPSPYLRRLFPPQPHTTQPTNGAHPLLSTLQGIALQGYAPSLFTPQLPSGVRAAAPAPPQQEEGSGQTHLYCPKREGDATKSMRLQPQCPHKGGRYGTDYALPRHWRDIRLKCGTFPNALPRRDSRATLFSLSERLPLVSRCLVYVVHGPAACLQY